MKSSLFQFYFLDIRSIGAAEGIDGKKKEFGKKGQKGLFVPKKGNFENIGTPEIFMVRYFFSMKSLRFMNLITLSSDAVKCTNY